MRLRTLWLVASLVVLSAVLAPAQPAPQAQYYARVEYILTAKYQTSLMFSGNQVIELSAPPTPAGYELAFMRVEFPGGMPKSIIPVKADRAEVVNERTLALITYTGSIKLAASDANATCEARVVVSYVKVAWVPLKAGEVTFTVEEPPPPFTKKDLVVRFTIENHAPYGIQDVKGPDGQSLVGSEPDPDALRIDYKHLELNMSYYDLGAYSVTVKQDEGYVLPSSFIVIEPAFKEDTVAPGSSKRYGIGRLSGWRGIGAVVVVYSVLPLAGKGSGGVEVVGELVDFAYCRDEIVVVRAASFLVPNLNLRVYIRVYIVYGSWFEVRNSMRGTVNVLYTPVFIKEAGEWQPKGVSITVRESDVKDAVAAYLVVQLPSYGRVVGIRTPTGAELGSTFEGLLPWGSELRDVRVFMSEAYIQVKAFDAFEPGTYTFQIDWKPVTFKLVDDEGQPVGGAVISISGPINTTVVSDDGGLARAVLYKPGAYSVEVSFKGVGVAKLQLGTLTGEVTIKCRVYRVSWLVVNAWDKPLAGAEVAVASGENILARVVTSDQGTTPVVQVPGGQFVVRVGYKRVASTRVEDFSSSGVRKVRLDVLFELPLFGGIPITTLEAGLMSAAAGSGAVGLMLARGRKPATVEEEVFEE